MIGQIVFADVDGTLIHAAIPKGEYSKVPGQEMYITADAIAIISAYRQQGNKFVLITGRRKSGFEMAAEVIPHDYGMIVPE